MLGERCGRVPPSDHKAEIADPEKHDDFMYPGNVDFFTFISFFVNIIGSQN